MSTITAGMVADHHYQSVVELNFSPQTPFLVEIEELIAVCASTQIAQDISGQGVALMDEAHDA